MRGLDIPFELVKQVMEQGPGERCPDKWQRTDDPTAEEGPWQCSLNEGHKGELHIATTVMTVILGGDMMQLPMPSALWYDNREFIR